MGRERRAAGVLDDPDAGAARWRAIMSRRLPQRPLRSSIGCHAIACIQLPAIDHPAVHCTSIEPRAPPLLFRSVTRAPSDLGSTAMRRTAAEDSRAARSGRNRTPSVFPRTAASCRRRIARARGLRVAHASAISLAPEPSVSSKAQRDSGALPLGVRSPPLGIPSLAARSHHEHSLESRPMRAQCRRIRLQRRSHPNTPTRPRTAMSARRALETGDITPRYRSARRESRSGRCEANLRRADRHRTRRTR